jgi:DNA repair protein RadC
MAGGSDVQRSPPQRHVHSQGRLRHRGTHRKVEALRRSERTVEFARRLLQGDTSEYLIVIYLESRHLMIAYLVVSIGTANQPLVHSREIFQPTIAAGATPLVVLHNHPSGNVSPSAEDREVTQRLVKAGELLGIRLLDHVIFAAERAPTIPSPKPHRNCCAGRLRCSAAPIAPASAPDSTP